MLPVLTHSFPTRRSSDLFSYADAVFPPCAADQPSGSSRKARTWLMPLASSAPDSSAAASTSHQVPRPCSRTPSAARVSTRSEEHTSELQSLMRISYAVFCLKKKTISSQLLINLLK